ncbi:DUF4236 domain-containing protein [Klebsiella pneumoniae]|uniref:DUF4236 domain-containing protein n=1 Tax=Klebsiella pneumoniae TaxID=573 RepID=UPI00201492A4|nr:DUF4236 domain-containing protein [Klebsiella pneumoniae]MCL3500111.1 DUF4236 domain-containing protein [Klebsiella pneumoniae]MCP6552985.1 DUF4236 domain-containing protein [Klebsiella pneumoniae]MCP6581468.1 DUF4236 domain-containing protein [Klebsiella pneumoniae]MCP6611624.1 DUF4236 domain-containing protein [Klebsiella pneumoniae]MCQ0500096.1 DUF4236 domain-containing protein [Klebsiella pneumoniae]
MGFRFRKRIRIAPGLAINISKSGVSTSIGPKGATTNISGRGIKTTVGIPGSGLSYTVGPGKKIWKSYIGRGIFRTGTNGSKGRDPLVEACSFHHCRHSSIANI